MQHMVNKAYTRWVAAILISGHLAHAGNHRHGSAGHRQGQKSAHCTCQWTDTGKLVSLFTLGHSLSTGQELPLVALNEVGAEDGVDTPVWLYEG